MTAASRRNVLPLLAICGGIAICAPAWSQSPLAEIESPGAAQHQSATFRTETIKVKLAAKGDLRRGDQVEHMIEMKPGQTVVYSWTAPQGANLYHEFHGHTGEKVTFYKKAEGAAHHGSLSAPFEGQHGWYFENRGDKPVVVSLKLSGFYEPVEE